MKQFENIRIKKPQSSVFDLSHERKMTMNMAELTPILCQEVLPGDRFKVNVEMLLRMQPMLAPIMHRLNVYTHFFFVPNRLIWNQWEDYITGKYAENPELEPNHPKITADQQLQKTYLGNGSLADYLGFPDISQVSSNGDEAASISQLPFRAYQLIWNNYYRDQNLQSEFDIDLGSADADLSTVYTQALVGMRTRCWEKDYFTSCLPSAQRGAVVNLPLGSVNVTGQPRILDNVNAPVVSKTLKTDANGYLDSDGTQVGEHIASGLTGTVENTTISDLRRAYSLQRWFEKSMRFGVRYIEQIMGHFGIKSSDARLQRPEYLGGGRLPIQISEVLQLSQTDQTAQGTMAGHGVSAGLPSGFNRFFEEHGFIIGIMSVLPRTAYQQGLPRMFTRFDRYDYFFPDFAHIGEQPVYRRELYLDDIANDTNDKIFGYQPRYSEYRYMYDSVHGEMKDTLDFWHMGRKFDASPLLNESFVKANPTNRIFPVIGEDPRLSQLIVQLYTRMTAIRPIPKYGDPI